MERPKVTRELVAAAAADFCKREGWDQRVEADIAKAYRGPYMDGYELAKALENECGWTPTAMDVERLDGFGSAVRETHRQACIAWARETNVQPPLAVGSVTTRGEITGLCEYEPATYYVREPGEEDPSRRLIVKFEDAQVMPPVSGDDAAAGSSGEGVKA